MDCIKIMIGSELFNGFYNSMFSNSDEFLNDEMELKSELEEAIKDSNIEFEVSYEYSDKDWVNYKVDVCKAFRDVYMEAINDELPTYITDDDDFLFEVVDNGNDDNIIIYSPKYYNYTTDKCYWYIKTNCHTLKMIKDYTLKLDGCKEYLLDNFTSYDGFISFIKNDIEYWRNLDIKDFKDIYIISLLDMFLCLTNDDKNEDRRFKLNYCVYDDICKYNYAFPIIYYDDKEYKLNEFNKLMNIES